MNCGQGNSIRGFDERVEKSKVDGPNAEFLKDFPNKRILGILARLDMTTDDIPMLGRYSLVARPEPQEDLPARIDQQPTNSLNRCFQLQDQMPPRLANLECIV